MRVPDLDVNASCLDDLTSRIKVFPLLFNQFSVFGQSLIINLLFSKTR